MFRTIKAGEEIALPNIGLESVHHVHADDVAEGFVRAVEHWRSSLGESFHIVSDDALTLRFFAEEIYRHFGHEPALRFVPWERLRKQLSDEDLWCTWDHIGHSPCCSIEKARNTIEYAPRFGSVEAVRESLAVMAAAGKL